MTIENAKYGTIYEDYENGDCVPCLVDTDKMEVVKFMPAEECRWDDHVMCIEEWIYFDDGRSFEAIKFDEYNDAVLEGFDDEYDRANIVLFDADALYNACVAAFPFPVKTPRFENYFAHCALHAESSDSEDDAYSYAERLAWRGTEHIRDAAPMMVEAAHDLEAVNAGGFYDDQIAAAYAFAKEFEDLAKQADELANRLRNTFRYFG